jgi:hypothetical protein
VQKRILFLITILTSFYFIIGGCSKLDTTDIGSDLLPAVDNVNTFAAEYNITTTQGFFNPDTAVITRLDDHALGKINNDPLFGTTTANVFVQFKPSFYPFYWGNAGDTIASSVDSVVLCLSYKGYWGDSLSLTPLQLEVREVAAGQLWDSLFQSRPVNYVPNTGSVVGNASVDLSKVGNYVVYSNKKDSARNHIRIKLSSAFANSLFARDSLVSGNNTFRSDSAFRVFQKGLAIIASGTGNCLMYTNLTDSMSRLEVHFKKKNFGTGKLDTAFTSLRMIASATSTNLASVTANSIIRNRTGAEIASANPNYVYLQTSPGTYANLHIPALDTLSNRIVHRAEIIMDQVPDNPYLDSAFTSPDFLYLDLIDTGNAPIKWKPVYFDLNYSVTYDPDFVTGNFFPNGGIDYFTFGGFVRFKSDGLGSRRFYNFNITRQVQQRLTKHTPNYSFRLFAPYYFRYSQYFQTNLPGNNKIAKGRVRLGSGTNTNYRMRLRIVYSNIK